MVQKNAAQSIGTSLRSWFVGDWKKVI